VRYCIGLGFSPLAHYVPLARAADESGWDTIAVSDHVANPETITSTYPYTKDGGRRWEPFTEFADPWVAIGAMAAATERLRFTTNVYVLPMRPPFAVAKAVGTAAAISGGRVALGVGMGWMEEEFALLEQPFRQRGRRADEMIEVLRALWAGGWVEHHGEFYDFDRLEMTPAPGEVPVYVGGLSDAALRRAARNDGWISDLHTTEELAAICGRLREYRTELGR
jgi:probable F420-dependent oxidoreductase